jgi:hypothetical protein
MPAPIPRLRLCAIPDCKPRSRPPCQPHDTNTALLFFFPLFFFSSSGLLRPCKVATDVIATRALDRGSSSPYASKEATTEHHTQITTHIYGRYGQITCPRSMLREIRMPRLSKSGLTVQTGCAREDCARSKVPRYPLTGKRCKEWHSIWKQSALSACTCVGYHGTVRSWKLDS